MFSVFIMCSSKALTWESFQHNGPGSQKSNYGFSPSVTLFYESPICHKLLKGKNKIPDVSGSIFLCQKHIYNLIREKLCSLHQVHLADWDIIQ